MPRMNEGKNMEWHVIEKDNPLAVHCHTWSEQRCKEWIEKYGDSKIFTNKSLTKESFTYVRVE